MKSPILVLLHPAVTDFATALRRALEPHRLNDQLLESIRAHHWDYWYFPQDSGLSSGALARMLPPELVGHAAPVADLPAGYPTTGIISPDGNWHDLSDFGWKLIREPSAENDRARAAWECHATEVLSRYADHVAVEIITHC